MSKSDSTAFGLDLAGYSSGKSGFARADRQTDKRIFITIYRNNLFCRHLKGRDTLPDIATYERQIIESCLNRACLVVDVPIDLQGLPNVNPVHFKWELTLRPVDFAFSALPALADRIGAPVARFINYITKIQQDTALLGQTLWETYPAASLQLLNLISRGYKGKSTIFEADEWRAAHPGHQPLANIINKLDWLCEEGLKLTDDEFDAALCALTGVADARARVEGNRLEEVIRNRISLGTEKTHRDHIRATPPQGYVLLELPPMEPVYLCVKQPRTLEETLREVAQ